jgi:predicted nucleic acid-binding protein
VPTVCIDASLVVLSLLHESLSEDVDAAIRRWRAGDGQIIAPPLIVPEVSSVLRQAVFHGKLSEPAGDEALRLFENLDIDVRAPDGLLGRAWDFGKRLNVPRLYDMFYVALAAIERCDLWTADKRLANVAARQAPFVRWVGDVAKETSSG